jgi:protein N-terminal amidase
VHALSCAGVQVVVLPEMAFAGYTFRDEAHVRPLAERAATGATHAWCASLAARLDAYVACGYPEEAEDATLYNAQMVVAPNGQVVANHRKHHLFATDKTWAQPGGGWTSCRLRSLRVRAFCGVCMDINPWEFTAPWEAYEWASAAKEARAGLLLFSSAWCDRNPEDPPGYVPPPIDAHSTLGYWAARLQPLMRDDAGGGKADASSQSSSQTSSAVHFVCADRIGREGDTTFCGCSCVMALRGAAGGSGRATLLSALGVTTEGTLLCDVDALTDKEEEEEEEEEEVKVQE